MQAPKDANTHPTIDAQLTAFSMAVKHVEDLVQLRLKAVEGNVDALQAIQKERQLTWWKLGSVLTIAVAFATFVIAYIIDRPHELLRSELTREIVRLNDLLDQRDPRRVEDRLSANIESLQARVQALEQMAAETHQE